MVLKIKKIILLLSIFMYAHNIYAQEVGVVLSGGGAKGLYHIGILKALEENNIPIDYISGTSMGAIIAGLYAAGYTPWEIERIVMGPEIATWVSGKIDQQYAYFYNQMPERPAMVDYSIDMNHMISSLKWKKKLKEEDKIPTYYDQNKETPIAANLVSSTQLDIGLMEYLSGANAVAKNDFDSLYIPFRCVSVDAVTKTQRFWDSGSLSLAIRASMAIPIFFSPVIVDSTVMFDGSVLNNFPWKESYNLWKPDLLIGGRCVAGDVLDVSSPTGQAMALMFSPTDYNLPDSLGIMIGQAVDAGVLDFTNVKRIIDLGYEDAMKAMPKIIERTPRFISKKQRERERLEFKKRVPRLIFYEQQVENELHFNTLLIDSTNISDTKRVLKDSLRLESARKKQKEKELKEKDADKKILDINEFKHKYYTVITEGSATVSFPHANYNDSTGVFDFDIKLDRKPILSIKAGLNISSSSINQLYLGLSYKMGKKVSSFYNVDGYVGSFYSSGQASTRHNFYNGKKDIYLYNTFTYNNINFDRANNQKFSYINDANSRNNTMNEFYVSSLLGMPIGVKTKFELRAAVGFDNFRYGYNNFDTPEDFTEYKSTVGFSSLNATISSYSLDDTFHPTKGYSQQFSASVMYGIENVKWRNSPEPEPNKSVFNSKTLWASVRYSRTQFFELSKRFSLGYSAEGLISITPKLSDHALKYMAPKYAPTQFTETMFIPELQNYTYVAAGIIPVYKITEKLEVRAEAHMYYSDIANPNKDNLIYIGSALLMYKLPFASVSLAYNRLSYGGENKHYFIFNFGVMLFNPRGVVY